MAWLTTTTRLGHTDCCSDGGRTVGTWYAMLPCEKLRVPRIECLPKSQVIAKLYLTSKLWKHLLGGKKNPLGISYLMNSHHLVVISLQCPLKAITAQLWHLHTNTPRSLSELLAWHYHVSTYSKNGWREPLGNDYLNAWQTRMQTKLPSWWWSLKPTSPRAPQEKILSRDLRSDWGCVEHLPLQVQWPWNGFRLWCYILRWALPFWKLTWMYNIQCTHFMCQTDIAT